MPVPVKCVTITVFLYQAPATVSISKLLDWTTPFNSQVMSNGLSKTAQVHKADINATWLYKEIRDNAYTYMPDNRQDFFMAFVVWLLLIQQVNQVIRGVGIVYFVARFF
jgi:hypothetical protein